MATLSGFLELAAGLAPGQASKSVPRPGPPLIPASHDSRAGSFDSARRDLRERSAASSSRARSPPSDREQADETSKEFTPSCSRCRQKKLKCDCKTPCGTCVAKGLGDECHKDRRIPRGRKRPRLSGPADPAEEIMMLRKRLAASEAQCHALRAGVAAGAIQAPPLSLPPRIGAPTTGPPSHSPRSRNVSLPSPPLTKSHSGISSSGQPSTSPSSPYDPLPSPRPPRNVAEQTGPSLFRPRRGTLSEHHDGHSASLLGPPARKHSANFATPAAEAAASALEAFERSGRRRTSFMQHDGPLEPQGLTLAPDRPHPYWSRPETYGERRKLLDRAREILPDEAVVMELLDTFAWRANHIGGHMINTLELRREARDALHVLWHPEPRVMDKLSLDRLAMILLVLCIALEFHPRDKGGGPNHDAPAWRIVVHLAESGDVAGDWYELATHIMALDKSDYELTNLMMLQNASLLLLYARGKPSWQRLLLRSAIQAAQDMRLHQLGSAKPTAFARSEFPRVETAVRVWHWLCVKDWCSAQEHGVYTIQPTQSNTRRPLNINDTDLEAGVWQARPASDWTELSYVLCLIDLVDRVREHVDVKLHHTLTASGGSSELSPAVVAELDEGFHRYLDSLPPFFALGSTSRVPPVVPPQRWLLQQQVFNQLLRLHRRQLASPSARSSCLGLAHNVFILFSKIGGVCPIIDGAYISSSHLFEATCVVLLDLFLHPSLTSAEDRQIVRRAVEDTLHMQGRGRPRTVTRVLLDEEEAFRTALRQGRESGGPQHLKVIVDRIASIKEVAEHGGDYLDSRPRGRAARLIKTQGLMPALVPDSAGREGDMSSLSKLSPPIAAGAGFGRPSSAPRLSLGHGAHQPLRAHAAAPRGPTDLVSVQTVDANGSHGGMLRGPPPPGWTSNVNGPAGAAMLLPPPPPPHEGPSHASAYSYGPGPPPPYAPPTGFRHTPLGPHMPQGTASPSALRATSPVQDNALFEWILQQGPA